MAVAFLCIAFLVTVGGVHSQSLRLNYYSTTSNSHGRLEVYHINEWIPFTINGFDMHEADLACRLLGYSSASRYATVGALGYSRSTSSYSAYLVCSSTATLFMSCTFSTSTRYSHYSDVGLQCTNSRSSLRLLSSTGTTGSSFGRLQIYINNTWGTVCDDNFGNQEAGIACRQLGYAGYSSYYSSGTSTQSTSYGPIWLDNLNSCTSSSTDLRNCTRAVGVHDCSHSEDIILSCSTSSNPQTNLRLISSDYTSTYLSQGRLEVYYPNSTGQLSWMPFCYYGFSSRAADLACKQLGYRRASVFSTVGTEGYGSSSSASFIGSVTCYTSDSELRYCTLYTSLSGCSAFNQVALTCSNSGGFSIVGLIVGLVIGSLVLVSCCCVGILMCVVIVTVISRKKKMGRVRTTNVARNLPNPMSNIAAQENVIVPTPAPPYTPNPLPSEVLQQEIHQPQIGINTISNDACEEEKKDLSED